MCLPPSPPMDVDGRSDGAGAQSWTAPPSSGAAIRARRWRTPTRQPISTLSATCSDTGPTGHQRLRPLAALATVRLDRQPILSWHTRKEGQVEKTVVITGGTGGLGTALIRRLQAEDYRLAVTYLLPEEATAFEEEVDVDEDRLCFSPGSTPPTRKLSPPCSRPWPTAGVPSTVSAASGRRMGREAVTWRKPTTSAWRE